MNGEGTDELPEGWEPSTIGECFFDIRNGTTLTQNKSGVGIPITRIETIQNQRFDLNRVQHIEQIAPNDLEKFRYRAGDIALSHINSYEHVGKSALYSGEPDPLIHGMNLLRLRLEHGHLEPRYLHLYFHASAFRDEVRERSGQAVNQVSINQSNLSGISIPIAPLAEQRRIGAAVEAVLAKVNAARDRLNRVPAILKRFRQAVLSAACSGRLTADWRGAADDEEVGEALPHLWQSVPLRSISSRVTDGTHLPPPLTDAGIPFVLIGNVVEKKLDWSGIRKWVSQETYERLTARCKPERGDVLYTAVGATFGQALTVETDRPFIFQRHIAHIKPLHQHVDARYLVSVLNSPEQYRHASEVARGAAQPTVTLSDLKEFIIPLPPLAEQQEIVRRVGELFVLADRIEGRLADARQMADQLTQAVLAKAFRGELVPTEAELARRENRTYEPATDLLTRIRAERDQPAAPTNGKPKRPTSPKSRRVTE